MKQYTVSESNSEGAHPRLFHLGSSLGSFDLPWLKIEGGKVVISSDKVPNPVAVRYAWANNPPVNLYNGANLPVAPFRTDAWEIPELLPKSIPSPPATK